MPMGLADEGRRKSLLLHGQISVWPPVVGPDPDEPFAPHSEIFDGEPQEEEMELAPTPEMALTPERGGGTQECNPCRQRPVPMAHAQAPDMEALTPFPDPSVGA